jgi:transposase
MARKSSPSGSGTGRHTSALTTAEITRYPLLHEPLYIGIDVGKNTHFAGFVSRTLLQRHDRFEGCPALKFDNSREGFRGLVERIESYAPLEQCMVLLEKTGHYQQALTQYLLDLDVAVYLMHVQSRPAKLLKTDKRDALGLANTLYTQLELGAQVADKAYLVRRAVPPTEAATMLRSLIRHHYELTHEATQRKNKLTALCDELFPEFARFFKDPNAPGALVVREHFPTPQALATASVSDLTAIRVGRLPATTKLLQAQEAAQTSIGTHNLARQRGLILEQKQLIRELRLVEDHLQELNAEIAQIVDQAREGHILRSIPGIGPVQAGAFIAAIGHIDNFRSAAALRAYCGWAPQVVRSGVTLDHIHLGRGGTRTLKQLVFLMVGNAIQMDTEWAQIYQRLVESRCAYDERTKQYTGKVRIMGRIAGQMIGTIYALLKQDAEALARHTPRQALPEPILYDSALHHSHRIGHYHATKPPVRPHGNITALPHLTHP